MRNTTEAGLRAYADWLGKNMQSRAFQPSPIVERPLVVEEVDACSLWAWALTGVVGTRGVKGEDALLLPKAQAEPE
jgi:hypothetical protein